MHKSCVRNQVRYFGHTYRYIDDVLSLNNTTFGDYLDSIYPSELEIKDTTDEHNFANYLDIRLEFDVNTRLFTKVYDKRDDLNFPFLCGNIPNSTAYGIFVSQLIRYAKANTFYDYFKFRCMDLVLARQGFKLSFKKCYGRHTTLHFLECLVIYFMS